MSYKEQAAKLDANGKYHCRFWERVRSAVDSFHWLTASRVLADPHRAQTTLGISAPELVLGRYTRFSVTLSMALDTRSLNTNFS